MATAHHTALLSTPATVGDVMVRSPRAVTLDDTLGTALEQMELHKLRHLPVIERTAAGEKVCGILSDRDICRQLAPKKGVRAARRQKEDALGRPVHVYANRSPVSCAPERCVHGVAAMLLREGVESMVVTDGGSPDGILLGLFSVTELVHVAGHGLGASVLPDATVACSGWGLLPDWDQPLASVMTRSVMTFPRTLGVREGAAAVLRHRIHHLPVAEGGKLLGMVSDRDLLCALEPRIPSPKSRRRARLLEIEPSDAGASTLTLEQLMATSLITASAEQTVADAARLFAKHGVHSLPVLGRGGALEGLVTTSDFIAMVAGWRRVHCAARG